MKIESRDADVESLLDSSYFHIPRFQRPYSWEDEHIYDFWEDIVSNQSDDYFIGSMVVYKKSKQFFGIVDGQQRLTTITILLCVLRDAFSDLGARDLAKGIHQLVERKDRRNRSEYVLKTETSFPYFQEHIQKFDDVADAEAKFLDEERNLHNAHLRFKALVSSSLESVEIDTVTPDSKKNKKKLAKLESLRDAVLNLKVIFVVLEDEDDAYIIFETLNTRGKDLALTDLVKNHFTKHLKARGEVDHARLKWEGMLETIHNSSESLESDNFIYHFWASRYEAIPQRKLFKRFKKVVTKPKSKDYLGQMVDDAKIYRSLFEASYGWNKNEAAVARSLTAMQTFKLSQPVPALLSLVRAYRDGKIKYARLKDALIAIEKFHFHFTAITSSRSSGGISAMYSSFGQRLYRCDDSAESAKEIDDLKNKLRDRVPSRDEFTVAFKEVAFTNSNSKQKSLVQYILRKFAEYQKYSYPVDFDELTIEHIYPQSKISGRWPEELVGSLGNLIFLDAETNEKLAAKDFEAKRQYLVKNGYSIPRYVAEAKNWTPKIAQKHTEVMAGLAYDKVWKI